MALLSQVPARAVLPCVLALLFSVYAGSLPAQQYSASTNPDRILLLPGSDPAREYRVSWRTSGAQPEAIAEIAVATAAPAFAAHRVTGSARGLHSESGVAMHHQATFSGLEPDTAYVYRVAGTQQWSEWFQFRTAADAFTPHTILYFGDAQNAIRTSVSRTFRQAVLATLQPRLLLHAGDLIDRDGSWDAQWGEWFAAGGWIHGSIAALPAAGNHEYDEQSSPIVLSPHWSAQFPLPANGPAALESTVYSIVYQGVRYFVLDSTAAVHDETMAMKQADWMRELSAEDGAVWTVALFHHPLLSVSHGTANPNLEKHWRPVFEELGVDLVLQGHDHVYGRRSTVFDADGAVRRQPPVYLVSVAGAKMNLVAERSIAPYEAVGEDAQLYQVIHYDTDALRLEARTAAGDLYDVITIHRDASGDKWLEDDGPSTGKRSICGNPDNTPAHVDQTGRARPGRCRL